MTALHPIIILDDKDSRRSGFSITFAMPPVIPRTLDGGAAAEIERTLEFV